jgi:hypothetical protein
MSGDEYETESLDSDVATASSGKWLLLQPLVFTGDSEASTKMKVVANQVLVIILMMKTVTCGTKPKEN